MDGTTSYLVADLEWKISLIQVTSSFLKHCVTRNKILYPMADYVNSSIMQHQTGTAFINGKCLNKEKQRTEIPPHKIGFTIQSTNCIST